MKLSKKQLKIMTWTTRIAALAVLLFGLPFYFGYGNPLPFINPDYTLFDNIWLSAFPLIFIGLALGWKWEKVAGYLITMPIVIATIIGVALIRESLPGPMFVPLIIGIFYLIIGYNKK
ncbi:MAG: hypothetical protein OQK82_00465 [Candidatus Pacearchaeota archaeon]|nr:hypothetical protein [Candidatus Pacearchaeota archaeon]